MLLGRWPLLFATLLVAVPHAYGQNTTPVFSSNEAGLVHACDVSREPETPCRLPIVASPDVLGAMAATTLNADVTGDTVTFVVDAPSIRSMTMVGGLRLSLEQIPETTLWGARVLVPRMREATISFRFLTDTTTAVPARRSVRGSAAPPRPLRSADLHGSLRVDTLNSVALAMPREIISYVPHTSAAHRLPVIYLADGAAVRELAPMIDTLIASGRISPVLLVGVRAARSVPGVAGTELDRAREYVHGFESDSARFLAHETFFVEEVSAWAEKTLKAANTRTGRSLWGASNGGAFAVAMGLRHPDRFGQVFAASPVYASIPKPADHGRLPRFVLSAGAFERIIQQTTSVLAETLRDLGASAQFDTFVGGHDDLLWSEALVRSLVLPVTAGP